MSMCCLQINMLLRANTIYGVSKSVRLLNHFYTIFLAAVNFGLQSLLIFGWQNVLGVMFQVSY